MLEEKLREAIVGGAATATLRLKGDLNRFPFRDGSGIFEVKGPFRGATLRYAPPHFRYPVAIENRPSRRIAEKLGGTIIGRYRTRKHDGVIYAIPPMGPARP